MPKRPLAEVVAQIRRDGHTRFVSSAELTDVLDAAEKTTDVRIEALEKRIDMLWREVSRMIGDGR